MPDREALTRESAPGSRVFRQWLWVEALWIVEPDTEPPMVDAQAIVRDALQSNDGMPAEAWMVCGKIEAESVQELTP